jgi:hypothetical protein
MMIKAFPWGAGLLIGGIAVGWIAAQPDGALYLGGAAVLAFVIAVAFFDRN